MAENGNTIQGNDTGIKCDAGSNPLVEWNTIASNDVGVAAVNNSNPDIGNGASGSLGNNSITQSATHHVANLSPLITIAAENNWWGTASGPHPSKILAAVDYTPWESAPPGAPPPPSSPFMKEDENRREDRVLPKAFALASNYPNPFNPVTTIKFEVPPPGGHVSVGIYNIRGERVNTLVSGDKAPGFHFVVWRGRNDRGGSVASGVYFVLMKAKEFRETKKLVLLK